MEHEEEDSKNPSNQYHSQNIQTCLVSLYPDNESEYLEIAPGEGKKPQDKIFYKISFVRSRNFCIYFQLKSLEILMKEIRLCDL